MSRPVQPRLPVEPLFRFAGVENHGHAARMFGVSRREVVRWVNRYGGVPVLRAERIAEHIGVPHGTVIWGPAFTLAMATWFDMVKQPRR